MTFVYILLAILLLSILIAIHEFGHYATARLTGIPVREFAIGMGPKLISHTSKKTGIDYSLRLIPMGGFCAFVGEDDVRQIEADDPRCWAKQKLWKRFLTVLMGPGMNFILAFVVLLMSYWIGGLDQPKQNSLWQPYISSVETGGQAEVAGICAGDYVTAVNGQDTALTREALNAEGFDVKDGALSVTIRAWEKGDEPITLTLSRGGEAVTAQVTPAYDKSAQEYRIGIGYGYLASEYEHLSLGFGESVTLAWDAFKYYSTAIFDAVIGLFRGQNLDQVSGPIGTVSVITEQVRDYGFEAFVSLLALISVNLGIMNLLPIPGLDGSRLVFMIIEAIRGKPVPPEKEAMVHLAGFVLIFGLMIFISVRDIQNLFH